MPPGKPLSIFGILKSCQLYPSEVRKDFFFFKEKQEAFLKIVIPVFTEQLECAKGCSRHLGIRRPDSGTILYYPYSIGDKACL